jgi:hypothetical protein
MLLVVAMLGVLVLPMMHEEWGKQYAEIAHLRYPVLAALCTAIISFFVASYQVLKLLNYIDSNRAFSTLSVKALRTIKHCALVVSSVFAAGMPLIYYTAEQDDAPGLIIIGLFFTFAPVVVAVFAAVVQRLLQDAIAIKSENDLTV